MMNDGETLGFSPLKARKWAAGKVSARREDPSMGFQSSQGEEVGCGLRIRYDGQLLRFQSSQGEEVGCGVGFVSHM